MKVINNITRIDFLDERFYTKDDDRYYPSVSYILETIDKGEGFKTFLKQSGVNADYIANKAAESGSRIHDAINKLLLGKPIQWDDKVYDLQEWESILKFQEFWNRFTPELIATEEALIDEYSGYAGTLDLVCKFKDQIWLIDFKSSNALYNTYEVQMAAYRQMWNRLNPKYEVDRMGIFWFKSLKKGEDKKDLKIQGKGWEINEPKDSEDWVFYYRLFVDALDWFKYKYPNAKPRNKSLPTEIKLNVTTLK